MEDSRIIDLFFARDEQAIKELSEKYGTVCKKISENILGNELDAEECINDAYLAAWNTIPPQKPSILKTYILRLVRNISISKYHSNTAKKRNSYYDVALSELEEVLSGEVTPETELSGKELSRHIDAFLDTLDKENRLMFMFRYWYSESISDIAKEFGITSHNVTVRLSRIREKLKNYLKKEGYFI